MAKALSWRSLARKLAIKSDRIEQWQALHLKMHPDKSRVNHIVDGADGLSSWGSTIEWRCSGQYGRMYCFPRRPISMDTCLGARLPVTRGVRETSRRHSTQRRPWSFLSSP